MDNFYQGFNNNLTIAQASRISLACPGSQKLQTLLSHVLFYCYYLSSALSFLDLQIIANYLMKLKRVHLQQVAQVTTSVEFITRNGSLDSTIGLLHHSYSIVLVSQYFNSWQLYYYLTCLWLQLLISNVSKVMDKTSFYILNLWKGIQTRCFLYTNVTGHSFT